jgi:hypothetical protein
VYRGEGTEYHSTTLFNGQTLPIQLIADSRRRTMCLVLECCGFGEVRRQDLSRERIDGCLLDVAFHRLPEL